MESTRTFCSNITRFVYKLPADEGLANPIKDDNPVRRINLIVGNALRILQILQFAETFLPPQALTILVEHFKGPERPL